MRHRSAILSVLGSLLAAPGPVLAVSVEPVALTGDPAPGTGGSFAGFLRPVLGDGGVLAFGASSSAGSGVWSRPAAGGAFQLEARVGEPRPELGPGATLHEVEALAVDDSGQVALFGRIRGLPVPLPGPVVWLPDGSGGHAVALKAGDPAPGTSGATFGSFFSEDVLVGDAGDLTFRARLSGTGVDATNDQGIWAPDETGNLQLVVRQGDHVPGFPPRQIFFPIDAQLSESGDVATIIDRGLAIFSTRGPGTFDPLFLVGDPAPGAPAGATFSSFDGLLLNGRGDLAFDATADGGFGGIWVSEAGQDLELRVAPGDPLPGAPGIEMAPTSLLAFDDAGGVAFRTVLSGIGVSAQNDFALVAPDGAGGMNVIYREGDEIAGLPEGTFLSPYQVLLNAAGDAVILAQTSVGVGLFVAPAGGKLKLVAMQGQPFEVAPGDVRRIDAFGEWDIHTNYIQLRRGSLSDSRHFAFEAFFSVGDEYSSGLFLVTLPEPGTALLVLGGLTALTAGKRRFPRAYSA